jgi:HEAT repeat protein
VARRPSLDAQVQAIQSLRDEPENPDTRRALERALDSKHNMLAAAAAQVIAHVELSGLDDALAAAFERCMHDPAKTDRGCFAKSAIADALYKLESDRHELFLRGVRHIQLEPAWGGAQDTAAVLRGTCGLALVRCNYIYVMLELARLLADGEVAARVAAAQAIAYSTDEAAGAPLLRHKVLAGDQDVRDTAACLSALLSLSSERAVDFVAELTERGDSERREAAVLALGESRLPAALSALRSLAEQPIADTLRQVATLAIAMLRNDEAWSYLVRAIEDAPEGRAREAIEALSNYRHDRSLRARVEAAVDARGDPPLSAFARERFGKQE